MKVIVLSILSTIFSLSGYGQYFQFSQYNFTSQRVNPGMVSSSNYATASLLYRNQSTGGGFHLSSNILNISYPLINRKGTRWSGLGISFMDDRAGQSGLYTTQEASLSYAVNISLSKFQTLSLGIRILHAQRRIDLGGLYTGMQYIPDRGFDDGVSSGENFEGLRNKILTFSTGLYWQQIDKKGNKIAYWGLSIFDLNRPDDVFLRGSHSYPSALVGIGSFRVYNREKLSVFPEVLYTLNAARHIVNAGVVTSYELNSYRNRPSDKIDIITKYAIGRSAILGIQFYRDNFSFGVSYDFPFLTDNVANTGALELGVEWHKLVDPKEKQKRRNRKEKERNPTAKKPAVRPVRKESTSKEDSLEVTPAPTKSDMSIRLKHKQDSLQTAAKPGDLKHEPLVLEEAILRFGFNFNSSELNDNSKEYLDELAKALIDNPKLIVQLTGHTDNIGSAKFNLRLSMQRAQSLKDQLLQRGVSEGRIEVFGKGLSEPLNDNATEEKRAINRRVEMKIIYAD